MRHHLTHLRAMDLLMAFLSIISVLLVTARWWGHESLTPQTLQLFYDLDSLICYFFLAHFAYGWLRAPDRKAFFMTNWIYLPGSLPMVEQLRWARLLQLWRVYQLFKEHPDLWAMFRRERNETTLSGILFLFFLLLGVGSGVMYWIESGQPGSQIETPYDAFWWTLVTLSTVGYGDLVPKTEEGRFVASLLILFGVGLFGAISGFMASIFFATGQRERNRQVAPSLQQPARGVVARVAGTARRSARTQEEIRLSYGSASCEPAPSYRLWLSGGGAFSLLVL